MGAHDEDALPVLLRQVDQLGAWVAAKHGAGDVGHASRPQLPFLLRQVLRRILLQGVHQVREAGAWRAAIIVVPLLLLAGYMVQQSDFSAAGVKQERENDD